MSTIEERIAALEGFGISSCERGCGCIQELAASLSPDQLFLLEHVHGPDCGCEESFLASLTTEQHILMQQLGWARILGPEAAMAQMAVVIRRLPDRPLTLPELTHALAELGKQPTADEFPNALH